MIISAEDKVSIGKPTGLYFACMFATQDTSFSIKIDEFDYNRKFFGNPHYTYTANVLPKSFIYFSYSEVELRSK